MNKIQKIFGLAGSGKTHFLASEIVDRNLRGIPLEQILAISFTKAAGQSLKEKCSLIYKESDKATRHRSFEYANIRTLHSFAHEYFVKSYFEGKYSKRNMYFNLDNFLPARRSEAIKRALSKLRLFSYDEVRFNRLLRELASRDVLSIKTIYEEYITEKAKKFDYADSLVFALNSLPLDKRWKFGTIDEAQDLTPLHWEIVKKHILPNVETLFISGDPTQSIHIWAGADPTYFLDETKIVSTEPIIELKESWRIPKLLLSTINSLQRQMTDGTAHFQITSQKDGGELKYYLWQRTLSVLRDLSDERKDVLVLSLSGKKLAAIGDSLINAGILFMQDKRSEFNPWTPTVTKSDWYAYSLYFHIYHKNYDTKIEYWRVRWMVDGSSHLSELWDLFRSDDDGPTEFTITVKDLMRCLQIPEDLDKYSLIKLIFSWPPRNRWLMKTRDGDENQQFNRAHERILRYIENSGQGPYLEPTIKLSTVHGAKGLEAETVVILLTRDELRSVDEKRKLIINALSRSKKTVILTWLPEDRDYVHNHMMTGNNLSMIMSDEEFSEYLEAKGTMKP